jgi:hypothetical protein
MLQIDIFESRRLRDEGIEQVAKNSMQWHDKAMLASTVIRDRKKVGEPFIAEDLRGPISELIGEPHHHNCWGALVMALNRSRLIIKTGTYRQMALKSSHARITAEYVWSK